MLLCLQDGLWVGLTNLRAGLSVRSTQHSGTVPMELCRLIRALQTNPMEGEAFSLQGPSALGLQGLPGAPSEFQSTVCRLYRSTNLHIAAHSRKWCTSESVPAKLGLSQQMDLEAPARPISQEKFVGGVTCRETCSGCYIYLV